MNIHEKITYEQLNTMTDKEQLQLHLMLALDGIHEGTLNLPYRSKKGYLCRGRAGNLYRNFDIADSTIDELCEKIYKNTDSYYNINPFIPDTPANKKVYINYLTGIYIDIDIFHNIQNKINELVKEGKTEKASILKESYKNREYYKTLVQQTLLSYFDDGTLVRPSWLLFTGRGFALHYRYEEFLPTSDATLTQKHDLLYKKIIEKFTQLLNNELFNGILLDVDKRVKDWSRIARLAGTKNTKAGVSARFLSLGNNYSLECLAKSFGFDLNELVAEANQPKSKKTSKKISKKATGSNKKTVSTLPFDMNSYVADPIKPNISKFYLLAKQGLSLLRTIMLVRDWVEGEHRERYIFIFYNCAKAIYGGELAYGMTEEMNLMMKEPLSLYALNSAIYHTDSHMEETDLHEDGVYVFKTETILSEDWLDLSEEEIKLCAQEGQLKTYERNRIYAEHNEISAQRDKLIAELYLVKGYGYKKILQVLPDELKCTKGTIMNTIHRLGIHAKKGMSELYDNIKFNELKRYSCYKGSETPLTANNINNNKKPIITDSTDIITNHIFKKILPQNSITDTAVREELAKALKEGTNVFVTGPAGVGKNFEVLKFFEQLSKEEQDASLFLAPTNKLAVKLPNGKTIYNFFHIDTGIIVPNNGIAINPDFQHINRVIIDEIGMIRNDIFTELIKTINYAASYYQKSIQIILMGDFAQTKPILRRTEESTFYSHFSSIYAFDSEYWCLFQDSTFTLFTPQRQKDEEFYAHLLSLYYGNINEIRHFNSVLDRAENRAKDVMTIAPTNEKVNAYNLTRVAEIENKTLFEGKITGIVDINHVRTKHLNLELAIGMPVMAVINGKEFKNGMLGEVRKINQESVYVYFKELNKTVKVTKHKFELEHGTFTQLPLTYAYAITADKSQGMTFDEINVIPGFFSHGQLYVALSRCRTLEGIHLLGDLQEKEVIVEDAVLDYLDMAA